MHDVYVTGKETEGKVRNEENMKGDEDEVVIGMLSNRKIVKGSL